MQPSGERWSHTEGTSGQHCCRVVRAVKFPLPVQSSIPSLEWEADCAKRHIELCRCVVCWFGDCSGWGCVYDSVHVLEENGVDHSTFMCSLLHNRFQVLTILLNFSFQEDLVPFLVGSDDVLRLLTLASNSFSSELSTLAADTLGNLAKEVCMWLRNGGGGGEGVCVYLFVC